MAPELVWLGAALVGYVLTMLANPVRGYLIDGLNLLRERGRVRLWGIAAALSLVPACFGWAPVAGGGAGEERIERVTEVCAGAAALYVAVPGLRADPAVEGHAPRTRAALSIGAFFWALVAVGWQYFVLVALYLGVLVPERDPGWRGLFDFAWRRTARSWPLLLAAGGVGAASLWLTAGMASAIFWALVAAVAVACAFVQVCLLSGERGFADALAANFRCWGTLPYHAGWFVVVAAMHLFLLAAADAAVGAAWAGGVGARAWELFHSVARGAMLVWLLAAWVLLYCAKTKNPTRRRIRP